MNDLTVYKELYHFDDKCCLVINEITHDVRLMKRLKHYERNVYDFLDANHCEYIPEVYDVFEIDNELIVVEEYVRGSTFDVVINDTSMPTKTKLGYFIKLCNGLRFLHNAKPPIIHRDLKPSNIIVGEKGELWIIDYDAAKTFKPNSTHDTICLGTDGRAAPEQYGFMQSDARTDIYAVGTMLRDAFPNDNRIQKIAAKSMSFDPDNRYSSVDDLIDAINRKIGPSTKLKPLFPPPGFRSRTWWKIPIALVGYPLIAYCSISITSDNSDMLTIILTKVSMALSLLSIVDICNSWTGLYDILPFINDKRMWVRYPFRLVYSVIAIIVIISVCILIGGIIRTFLP